MLVVVTAGLEEAGAPRLLPAAPAVAEGPEFPPTVQPAGVLPSLETLTTRSCVLLVIHLASIVCSPESVTHLVLMSLVVQGEEGSEPG